MFEFIKKLFGKKTEAPVVREVPQLPPEEIFKLTDHEMLVESMYEYVYKKGGLGLNMDVLNESEKTLIYNNSLLRKVNNDGFLFYFSRPGSKFYRLAPEAFRRIGAFEIAEIAERAAEIYDKSYPDGISDYRQELQSDKEDPFMDCEVDFYEYQFANEGQLTELNYQFIMNNKADFT